MMGNLVDLEQQQVAMENLVDFEQQEVAMETSVAEGSETVMGVSEVSADNAVVMESEQAEQNEIAIRESTEMPEGSEAVAENGTVEQIETDVLESIDVPEESEAVTVSENLEQITTSAITMAEEVTEPKRIKFRHRYFVCHPCGKCFHVEEYVLHKQEVHGIDLGYTKRIRSRRTPKPVKLFQVENTKSTRKSSPRKSCKPNTMPSSSRNNIKGRRKLLAVVKSEDLKKCRFCPKKLSTVQERCNHEKMNHQVMLIKMALGIEYKCDYCSKVFASKQGRMKHKAKVHPEMVNAMPLMKRKPDVFKRTTYGCKMCPGFKFKSRSSLEDHIKIGKHVTEVEEGKDLGWEFAIIVKTVVKPPNEPSSSKLERNNCLECDKCLRVFPSEVCLEQHKLLHINPGSKQCRICHLQLSNSAKRQIHEVRFHLPNLTENELETLPQCSHCSKYFGAKFQLVRHKNLVHGELKPEREHPSQPSPRKVYDRKLVALGINRQCRICYKTFASSTVRRSHELTQHFENLSEEEISLFPQCRVCHQRFGTEYKLNRHMKSKHSPGTEITVRRSEIEITSSSRFDAEAKMLSKKTTKEITCPHCSKLVYENWLNAHIFKHHRKHFNPEGVTLYECMDCQEQFLYPSQLITHKLSHKEDQRGFFNSKKKFTAAVHRHTVAKPSKLSATLKKNFKCNYCPKTFVNRMKLRQHEPVHTGEKRYFCLFCDEVFTADYSLRYHKIRQHYEELSPEEQSKAVRCEDCGQHYGTETLMKNHAAIHHNRSGKYKCNLCPNRYADERRLKHHIGRMHQADHAEDTKKKRAPVETMYRKQKLIAVKTPTKTDKERNSVATIQKKTLQHTGLHKCSYCHQKFKTKLIQKRHEEIHTGKIYKTCRFCGSRIHGSSSYKYHLFRYHFDLLDEEEKSGAVSCLKCKLHFPSANRLKLHEQIHLSEQPYSCDLCSNQFKYRITLNKHMRKEHPFVSESRPSPAKNQKVQVQEPMPPQQRENKKVDAADEQTKSAIPSEELTISLTKTANRQLDNNIMPATLVRTPKPSAVSVTMNSQPGSSCQSDVRKKLATEDTRKSPPARNSSASSQKRPLAFGAVAKSFQVTAQKNSVDKSKYSGSANLSKRNSPLTRGQKQSITAASKFHLEQMTSQKSTASPRNGSEQSVLKSSVNQNQNTNQITITPLTTLTSPKTPKMDFSLISRSLLHHNQKQGQCLPNHPGIFLPQPPPAHSATTMTEERSSAASCSRETDLIMPAQKSQPPPYAPRKAIPPGSETRRPRPQPVPSHQDVSKQLPSYVAKPITVTPLSLPRQPKPVDDPHNLVAHLPSISLHEVADGRADSDDEVVILEEIRPKLDPTARPVKQEIYPSTGATLVQTPPANPALAAPVSITLGGGVTISSIPTKNSSVSIQHLGRQQNQSGVIVKNPQAQAFPSGRPATPQTTSRPPPNMYKLPAKRHSSNLQTQLPQELSAAHLSVLMTASKTLKPFPVPALSQAAQTLLLPKQLTAASSTLANLTGIISGTGATATSSNFRCSECSGSFGSAADLTHHQKTAHKLCRFCGLNFASHQSVERHTFGAHREEYIAAGGSYARCNLCGKEGRYKSCLNSHRCQGLMDKVMLESRKPSDEATFVCKYCGTAFQDMGECFLHLSTAHSEQYEKSMNVFMESIKGINNG